VQSTSPGNSSVEFLEGLYVTRHPPSPVRVTATAAGVGIPQGV
jgi:hypothetical protein